MTQIVKNTFISKDNSGNESIQGPCECYVYLFVWKDVRNERAFWYLNEKRELIWGQGNKVLSKVTGETANLFIRTTFREHFDKYRLINEKEGIKEALVTPS